MGRHPSTIDSRRRRTTRPIQGWELRCRCTRLLRQLTGLGACVAGERRASCRPAAQDCLSRGPEVVQRRVLAGPDRSRQASEKGLVTRGGHTPGCWPPRQSMLDHHDQRTRGRLTRPLMHEPSVPPPPRSRRAKAFRSARIYATVSIWQPGARSEAGPTCQNRRRRGASLSPSPPIPPSCLSAWRPTRSGSTAIACASSARNRSQGRHRFIGKSFSS